jgi:hypothetical protein
MFDDDVLPPSKRPASRLLDELESIKGALGGEHETDDDLPTDIPLLDDMVVDHIDDNAKLLNIAQIFDENAEADAPTVAEPSVQFPRFTLDVAISDEGDIAVETPAAFATSAAVKPRVRPDYSREVLIQELVDEFIPAIEAELHRRLRQLDDATLRRLKDAE